MNESFYPRLCGGVFFNILLKCKRKQISAKELMKNGAGGLADKNVLDGLVKIVAPDYKNIDSRSFDTQTSKYKKCMLSNSLYIPITEEPYVTDFDNLVKNDYQVAIKRTDKFIKNYLSDNSIIYSSVAWFLIKTISKDNSIDDNQLFYVKPDGTPVTKKQLCSFKEVFFQPLLLGIFHYIVVNRKDNLIGADTLEKWIPEMDTFENKNGAIVAVALYELSQENRISVESEGESEVLSKHIFNPYLHAMYFKYSKIKTLLYTSEPKSFYDFYVCNYLERKIPKKYRNLSSRQNVVQEVSVSTFNQYQYAIITGAGGLGKSMMMRHLLLDAINNYDTMGKVPILVSLKDFGTKYDDLFEYVYTNMATACTDISELELRKEMRSGQILLLLDGVDEIKTELVDAFKNSLDRFIDCFPHARIIMSSRPFEDFVEYSSFYVFELLPFTKEQALKLVDKLEFRPDEPDFKEKFKMELNTRLFYTHKPFAENPLLLTIMLMTFEQFAEIPSKMYVFYREAYITLSQKHDASKGGYKRALKTGLSADRFSDYLSEFCSRTYHDEKFEITYEEFKKYFVSLKENSRFDRENITADDFLYDLQNGMCLMYYESGKYHFIHRSFQEYFCALFFSKQKDKNLKAIGDFFEKKKHRMRGDMAFEMLYDMIPEHIEEYVLLPYLDELFKKCQGEYGYYAYLNEVYGGRVAYNTGCPNGEFTNEPDSYLMRFILNIIPYKNNVNYELPYYEEFVVIHYVDIINAKGEYETVEEDTLNHDRYHFTIIDENAGDNLEFDLDSILEDPEYYKEMIQAINDDN